MRSNIKLFGPEISEGLQQLSVLADSLRKKSSGIGQILSSSGRAVIGEVDFFFEWKTEPTHKNISELVSQIDNSMKDLKTHYSITTETEKAFDIDKFTMKAPNGAFSFFKFYGPSISQAISAMNNLVHTVPLLREGELGERELTMIGDFDYMFEWTRYPTVDEIMSVLKEIDKAIADSGIWYTITTKGYVPSIHEESKTRTKILEAKKEAQQDARKVTRFG
ncbi:MAG: hypothetical protein ACFFCQ_00475 [Promethearchaeota archaeon]